MLQRVLASPQAGLVLVILALGTVLTLAAGSHVDPRSGLVVNNFLNWYTLVQTATDASFFAIMAVGDRWSTIEESMDLLRRWWAGEAVDHQGAGYDFDGVTVGPTPVQDPLEIWLGGAGPRALERVGRLADGWLTATLTPAEAAVGLATVVAHAVRAGRVIDSEHFGISIPYAREVVPDAAVAALRARRRDSDLSGIVPLGGAELADLVARHIDAGLSKFVLRPLDHVGPPDGGLAWLADVVLPLQT
jgi:alkanesulfonate monooxygenase SsuD/methylene tetrahydromethanopterin reductase-like flavin-dependent oxidoreductase (luciferase family)